jgi:hypothetical protein
MFQFTLKYYIANRLLKELLVEYETNLDFILNRFQLFLLVSISFFTITNKESIFLLNFNNTQTFLSTVFFWVLLILNIFFLYNLYFKLNKVLLMPNLPPEVYNLAALKKFGSLCIGCGSTVFALGASAEFSYKSLNGFTSISPWRHLLLNVYHGANVPSNEIGLSIWCQMNQMNNIGLLPESGNILDLNSILKSHGIVSNSNFNFVMEDADPIGDYKFNKEELDKLKLINQIKSFDKSNLKDIDEIN